MRSIEHYCPKSFDHSFFPLTEVVGNVAQLGEPDAVMLQKNFQEAHYTIRLILQLQCLGTNGAGALDPKLILQKENGIISLNGILVKLTYAESGAVGNEHKIKK